MSCPKCNAQMDSSNLSRHKKRCKGATKMPKSDEGIVKPLRGRPLKTFASTIFKCDAVKKVIALSDGEKKTITIPQRYQDRYKHIKGYQS